MQARTRWTQKTSKAAADENRAGLSTSTPFSPAAASTSSSTITREEEDLMDERGRWDTGRGDQW